MINKHFIDERQKKVVCITIIYDEMSIQRGGFIVLRNLVVK